MVVTWTPPTGEISGYIIVYGPKDAPPPETLSAVNVDNPAVTAYTLEDITPESEYTIEMWAYLELPSSRSQPTTIHLDGENSIYKVPTYTLQYWTCDLLFCDGKQWKVSFVTRINYQTTVVCTFRASVFFPCYSHVMCNV